MKSFPERRPSCVSSAGGIAYSLSLRRSGTGYMGACPSCGYRGFQVRERDGSVLVKCHAGGCEQQAVLEALRRDGLWGRGAEHPYPHRPQERREVSGKPTLPEVGRLWRASRAAMGTPVAAYLAARGFIGSLPPDLRFLSEAKHTETGTRWPAMVAAVRHVAASDIIGLHRTFIRPDGRGKAPVDPNKKTIGPVSGGAVRLGPEARTIAVTEGIESGLSVLAATGVSTWAALSAGGVGALVLPPLPLATEVVICADHDRVGLTAADRAAERWHREGRAVRIALPPRAGQDFNDVMMDHE